MKNKKGFFLAETIAVIAVVGVVLIYVFRLFSGVYISYRQSEKYNTVASVNALANVQKYYDSVAKIDTTTLNASNPYVDLTYSAIYDSTYYTKLKEEYKVTRVYLIDLDNLSNHISDFNIKLRRYIKTILNKTGVVLVIEVNNDEYAYSKIKKVKGKICTFSGELVQGAEFIDGQYTYRYMQQGASTDWENIEQDGWGVILTDKTATTPVTTTLCNYINNKPIVSMARMYANSQASSINTSSFDTSHVVNMQGMFYAAKARTIDLRGFDTSNVTNMNVMFSQIEAAELLGLEDFNTENVTSMAQMFALNYNIYDYWFLEDWDVGNVTDMTGMFMLHSTCFNNSTCLEKWDTEIDFTSLQGWDTSSVTTMEGMFQHLMVKSFEPFRNWDTSNVTKMNNMFNISGTTVNSTVTSLSGLEGFEVDNVTTMRNMLRNYASLTDVSAIKNWNIANVTDIRDMLNGSNNITNATELDGWTASQITTANKKNAFTCNPKPSWF